MHTSESRTRKERTLDIIDRIGRDLICDGVGIVVAFAIILVQFGFHLHAYAIPTYGLCWYSVVIEFAGLGIIDLDLLFIDVGTATHELIYELHYAGASSDLGALGVGVHRLFGSQFCIRRGLGLYHGCLFEVGLAWRRHRGRFKYGIQIDHVGVCIFVGAFGHQFFLVFVQSIHQARHYGLVGSSIGLGRSRVLRGTGTGHHRRLHSACGHGFIGFRICVKGTGHVMLLHPGCNLCLLRIRWCC